MPEILLSDTTVLDLACRIAYCAYSQQQRHFIGMALPSAAVLSADHVLTRANPVPITAWWTGRLASGGIRTPTFRVGGACDNHCTT